MALFDRLIGNVAGDVGPGGDKISIHAFQAALHQWQDGGMIRAEVIAAFSLDAQEQGQLDSVKTLFQSAVNKERFAKTVDDLLLLAEARIPPYTTGAAIMARLSEVAAGN